MCGFAGVIAWDERYRVSRETLAKMSAAIAHRGPDGEGFHINHEEAITPDRPQVALAFRRLAILDPDPRSNQPFTDGRHWLVFNGEIYNFRELRKELSSLSPDYQWRTTGDTEVLLRSYAVWGEKCVEHLNGMFAFAVWDEAEKSLFLARDRMGQKPLYFLRPNDASRVFAFASEIGGIAPFVQPRWDDEDWLYWYLLNGCLPEAHFRVISVSGPFSTEPLPPGACMRFQRASLAPVAPKRLRQHDFGEFVATEREYYYEQRSGSLRPTVDVCRSLVRGAVERQLVSDVPLGIFLSGGVDSSVVAACARRHSRVQTFSIGFGDARYDESSYARKVAKHLDTDHHEFEVTPRVFDDLPRLAACFGVPFADSSALPTYYLSRETRKLVKVALSGDGGDELFGGYDRYVAMSLPSITRLLLPLQPLGSLLARGHPKSAITRAGRFVRTAGLSVPYRYLSYIELFDAKLAFDLSSHPSARLRLGSLQRDLAMLFQKFLRGRSPVEASLAFDRHVYLPNDLLTKVDRCSMLHGLEVRSPFMDHELVQFAAGLTTDQLLKGGPKRMLREAFADDLPAWVFKRKKMGFAVPIGDWFRGELRPMLHDTLFSTHAFGRSHFNMKVVERLVEEHETERVDHSQRLYALLMLELWWNTVRR